MSDTLGFKASAVADELSVAQDESKTYPDGLPEDPLLPIFFASRPFLHASREKLYRT